MPRAPRIYLPFDSWPTEDQARWQAAFKTGDRFDGSGPGSHLAEATRRNLWISYARFGSARHWRTVRNSIVHFGSDLIERQLR